MQMVCQTIENMIDDQRHEAWIVVMVRRRQNVGNQIGYWRASDSGGEPVQSIVQCALQRGDLNGAVIMQDWQWQEVNNVANRLQCRADQMLRVDSHVVNDISYKAGRNIQDVIHQFQIQTVR